MYTISNTLVNTMTRQDPKLLVSDVNCYLQSYSIWVIALLWFANVATGMTFAFVAPTSIICALGNYLPTFSDKSSSPLDAVIDVLVMLGTVAIIWMDTYEMELKRRRNFLISGGSMKWVEDDKVIKRWFRRQWSRRCCWLPCPCNILLSLKDKNLDAQYSRFSSAQLMKYNSAVILTACISLFLDFSAVTYELRFNSAAEAKAASVNHATQMLPYIFTGGFLSIVPLLCIGLTFHLYFPRAASTEIPCIGKIGGARLYKMLKENKRLRVLVTSATQVVLPVFIVTVLILFPIWMHETGEQIRETHFPYNENLTFPLVTWEKIVGDPSAYRGVICKDRNSSMTTDDLRPCSIALFNVARHICSMRRPTYRFYVFKYQILTLSVPRRLATAYSIITVLVPFSILMQFIVPNGLLQVVIWDFFIFWGYIMIMRSQEFLSQEYFFGLKMNYSSRLIYKILQLKSSAILKWQHFVAGEKEGEEDDDASAATCDSDTGIQKIIG